MNILLNSSSDKKIDPADMTLQTQKRIWSALKKGYEYSRVADKSDQYLREHVFCKTKMTVLYVDLVDSTSMALELPEDKLAIIISSFAQEMAYVINHHGGYVLKFVGDAVIGYFVDNDSSESLTDHSIGCALSMSHTMKEGINPILSQYDYPELRIKIGIDYGQNIIVRYGADHQNSFVDIIGPTMNIAAKIQGIAKPGEILIGGDVYDQTILSTKKLFHKMEIESNTWKYHSKSSRELYPVFRYVASR